MAGDRLVHGVIQQFGHEVMKGAVVGAADIHGRPAPDRLQALQHFDVLGGVAGLLVLVTRLRPGPNFRRC